MSFFSDLKESLKTITLYSIYDNIIVQAFLYRFGVCFPVGVTCQVAIATGAFSTSKINHTDTLLGTNSSYGNITTVAPVLGTNSTYGNQAATENISVDTDEYFLSVLYGALITQGAYSFGFMLYDIVRGRKHLKQLIEHDYDKKIQTEVTKENPIPSQNSKLREFLKGIAPTLFVSENAHIGAKVLGLSEIQIKLIKEVINSFGYAVVQGSGLLTVYIARGVYKKRKRDEARSQMNFREFDPEADSIQPGTVFSTFVPTLDSAMILQYTSPYTAPIQRAHVQSNPLPNSGVVGYSYRHGQRLIVDHGATPFTSINPLTYR